MASSLQSPKPSSLPPAMEDGEFKNWVELPSELTSSILHRLGAIEILENAQKVCTSWRRVCEDPSMWRKIVMHDDLFYLRRTGYNLEIMCRHAVDRSQGGLLEIEISYLGSDSLLSYIADSSSNLRTLKLTTSYQVNDEGLIEAISKLPLLEDLEVSYCAVSEKSLKVVGKSCPNLKTLKLNRKAFRPPLECDDDALAVAATMPGLRHLQLFGNRLSNAGLNAILDNCPNLEHLDLRQCFCLKLVEDLEKRCLERIKVVRRPNASTHDYPFDASVLDVCSYIDDEGLGWADVYSHDEVFDYHDYDPYD